MSLHVGIIVNNTVFQNVTAVPFTGGGPGHVLQFSGRMSLDDIDLAQATTEQLLGYDGNGDQPYVGIWWDEHPALNAFYKISNVQVQIEPGGLEIGWWPWSFVATKAVVAAGYPITESAIYSALRVNAQSLIFSDTEPWHAVPEKATAYDWVGRGDPFVLRTGPGGSVRYYAPASQALLPSAFPTFGLTPKNYTDQRCFFKINGVEQVGQQVPQSIVPATVAGETTRDPVYHWEIGNSLMRLAASPFGSSYFADLYLPKASDATQWEAPIHIGVGAFDGAAFTSKQPAQTIEPTRISMEEVRVQFHVPQEHTAANSSTYLKVAIGIRRGSRFFTVRISSPWQRKYAIGFPTTQAMTTAGKLQRSSAINSNRVLFGTPIAHTKDNTNGYMYATAIVSSVDFMLAGESGTTAAPDDRPSLQAQYFAAQTETSILLPTSSV